LVQELLVKDSGVVEAASAKGVELLYLFMSEQEVVMGLQKGNVFGFICTTTLSLRRLGTLKRREKAK